MRGCVEVVVEACCDDDWVTETVGGAVEELSASVLIEYTAPPSKVGFDVQGESEPSAGGVKVSTN